MRAEMEALSAAIGYSFSDPEILRRALTHRSYIHENNPSGDGAGHNERLEFLGDSVLGLVVSGFLLDRFPGHSEGQLSKLKAHLVSATNLHEAAQALHLGDYLLLGRGEEMSGGRDKRALLANAMEAIIAAIYQDGGLPAARQFVVSHILDKFDAEQDGQIVTVRDFKGALQEMAQALRLPAPKYSIISEHGPEHSKHFVIEVRVGREWISQAEGLSKKSAGQKAAQFLLAQLRDNAERLRQAGS